MNWALAVALVALASPAAAHDGRAHGSTWTLDPLLLVPLLLAIALATVGWRRLRSRSSDGRAAHARGFALFAIGWLVLAGALVSPLHEGGERSFTMHMVEHELIMLVATLLLAASGAGPLLLWGMPRGVRRGAGSATRALAPAWRALTDPIVATSLQGAVMWAWHMPALFDRALETPGWHIAQHGSFVVASLLFWTAMLDVRHGRGRLLLSAACLFATSLIGGALGALMAFSSSPWYAPYAAMGVSGIGLDPVTDQQLAGLLMWVPGGLVHGAVALLCVHRWFQGERRGVPLAQG